MLDLLLFAGGVYLCVAFFCFSLFFVIVSIFPLPQEGPTGGPYRTWDHFWLSLSLGLTWPYGLTLLFKGITYGTGPSRKD